MCWIQILLCIAFFASAEAGWHNFLCPTEVNSTVYFPCDYDCKNQHGANYGLCGSMEKGNYNCYCGPDNGLDHPESLMCAEDSSNYHLICNVDCQCSHGAVGGKCNFERKVCSCYGQDYMNTRCPHSSVEEFALFVAEMAGVQGYVGKYVEPFLPPGYNYPDGIDVNHLDRYIG